MIIATLVGQGMTLPGARAPVAPAGRAPPSQTPNVRPASSSPRRSSITSGKRHRTDQVPDDVADGLRAQYLGRLDRLQTAPDDEDLEDDVGADAEAELALRRDLIDLQRQTLIDLRNEGRIGMTTLRTIEHDLDLEEARLSSA